MDPAYILTAAEWATAIAKSGDDVQSWGKLLGRHIKLAAIVAGHALPSKKVCVRPRSHNESSVMVAQSTWPSFHPIHCAASQGMLSAARQMLEESCSSQVSCFRVVFG